MDQAIGVTGWSGVGVRDVPPEAVRALEAAGADAGSVRLVLHSTLSPEGRFSGSWVALDPERLFVVGLGSDESPAVLELSTLTGARTVSHQGGGVLQVDVGGQPRDLVRFDDGHAAAFGVLAGRLERHIARIGPPDAHDGGADEAPDNDPADPLDFSDVLEQWREVFCGECGRRLPRNTRVCPACVKRTGTILRVLGFARPYRAQLMGMMGLMVLGTIIQLVPPQIIRILLDDVLPEPGAPGLAAAVGALAAVMVAQAVVNIARGRMAIWVGSHVTNSIRLQAFRHLQGLSLSYFNKQQTGALMSRINNDTGQMQGFLVDGIQYTVVNVLLVIGIMVAMIWMNPFLGLLVIVPMPLVVLMSALVWKRIHRKFNVLWHASSRVSAHLNDALMGVRVIKVFGREKEEQGRYEERADHYRDRLVDAERSWTTLIPALNFVVQSSLLLVWYFGASEVWGGRLTIGGLMAYISYLGLIYGPLQLLTRLNDWLSRSMTAAARVFEVLDTHPEVVESEDPVALPEARGRITLRDVEFGYEPHKPVIKGLSLDIEPGTMVGIVGHSGAGKSTLINLIGRLYDVGAGSIEIDGTDVRDLKIADLRRHVGYVLQETFLFNGSVADNIAYARPEASRKEVIRAAVAANAHSFVMRLADGYDTVVGERGVQLSGGERQRISIARAILHDPRILILDEATSSVDTETESKIQAALQELVKGRTTLAIAHRLSTLRHADRLIVLDHGKLAEQGTHDELMQLEDGVYRKLVEIQTEWSRTIGVGG